MPFPTQAHRRQKACLWNAVGFNENGQPTVGHLVEVRVRWKYTRKEAITADGNPITVDATVIVDRKIKPGSIMWLGSAEQWYGESGSSSGSAGSNSELMEVISYHETPDIRNRFRQRSVDLAFYKDTLPDSGEG